MSVSDFLMRLIVVVGIASVAAAAALVSRRGRVWRRRRFDPAGLGPGLHLFSSEECHSCDRARSTLRRVGVSFSEHTYEADAELLAANGIDRVPTLAWVGTGGRSDWVAEGVPSDRAIVRWVGP